MLDHREGHAPGGSRPLEASFIDVVTGHQQTHSREPDQQAHREDGTPNDQMMNPVAHRAPSISRIDTWAKLHRGENITRLVR